MMQLVFVLFIFISLLVCGFCWLHYQLVTVWSFILCCTMLYYHNTFTT